MTIRIATGHPALRYVLQRSAPLGTTVHGLPNSECPRETACLIDIQTTLGKADLEDRVFKTWLPQYIRQYGAYSLEIDGRIIECTRGEIRWTARCSNHAARRKCA